MTFLVSERFVFDTPWYNKHLSLGNLYLPISEIDEHLPFDHDKHLVGIFMVVPYKIPLYLD